MGQFASRAFDGDPYIDIMRALPDKELVWWVQKVLWLAEGMTIMEHFGRTYPTLFYHKCYYCNGAGTVTCPHCNGYKIKRAHAQPLKLSETTTVGKLVATADTKECEHCGTYGPWDNESEWQEEWRKWESRLGYYDRTYGELFNEWYEEVINDGRLDEDTQPEDEPMLPEGDNSLSARISKDVSKDKKRLKALMRRMGGHPYEHSHMMPYPVIDPHTSLAENLSAIGYNKFDLPPEMHPEKFPELLLEGPNGVLQQFDKEIQAEYLIMKNLDAAMRDLPKPAMFPPTAGTTVCPVCEGQAWQTAFIPNLDRMLRTEQPFWVRTFSRMSPYWSAYTNQEGNPSYSPWMNALARPGNAGAIESGDEPGDITQQAAQQQQQVAAGSKRGRFRWFRRLFGETPTQPPLLPGPQVAQLDAALRPGAMPQVPDQIVDAAGARRPDGGVDYGVLTSQLASALPSSPSYMTEYGTKLVPDAWDMSRLAAQLKAASLGVDQGSAFGPKDPLSSHPLEAIDTEEMMQQALQAPSGPLLGDRVLDARLQANTLLNPARAAARYVREKRAQDQDVAV